MTHLTSPNGTPAGALAFGTMQFGGRANESESRAMYDAARAAGLTHFDTAWIYTDGVSETLLGRFAKAEREQLYIATKVGNRGGAGVANLSAQFDDCRRRLGMDAVDLLYLHLFDPNTELAETLDWFARQQSDGLIRHIGLSNFAAWQVMKAQGIALGMGTRIDAMQPMYNLVKRQAEVEILPMAADQGIAVFPYSPLGGGLLTGKYAAGGAGRLTEDARYATRYGQDWMHRTAADFAALAREEGHDPATLAVAWVARHPTGPCPIISARSAAQLAPSLAALDVTLDDATYARISALSPTPPPATDRSETAI